MDPASENETQIDKIKHKIPPELQPFDTELCFDRVSWKCVKPGKQTVCLDNLFK